MKILSAYGLSLICGGVVAVAPAAAHDQAPAPAPAPAHVGAVDAISVTVANPLGAPRPNETIVLSGAQLAKIVPSFDLKKALVADTQGGAVLSQILDSDGDDVADQLVFQTDLGARATKTFKVRVGQRQPAKREDYKVYGRFVRERHDDFAWENDRVAHRVYGPALETVKKEPLISSGVDTWVKRVPRLVVNEWYMTDDYHQDHGDGADYYSVGKTRGCGGLGIWAGGKLHVSRNFVSSRVLANGPIRLVFELSYAPWDAGGTTVAERKRVTLDAGTQFNRFESTFTLTGGDKKLPAVAIGIAKHPGNVAKVEPNRASMGVWEPLDGGKGGNLGCGIVLAPPAKAEAAETETEYLLVTAPAASASASDGTATYYVGSAWDRAGPIANLPAWTKEAQSLSSRLAAPVKVSLTAIRAR